MFENAKWITRTPVTAWRVPSVMPPSPFLVKDFEITKDVQTATLNIVGLGQAAYYINSRRIPDSYLPTYRSCYYKTVFYNTFDIADMLTEGKNRLGVILGNTGHTDSSTTRYRSVHNKVIAQLDIVYTDGTTETVVSDTSWKTHDSPTLSSGRRHGDVYDARLELPDWCDPTLSADGWDNAFICRGAGGELRPLMCPPRRIKAVLKGVQVAPNVYDFGVNTAGWVRIKVRGERGSEIVIKYSELLTEDGQSIDQSNILKAGGTHIDRYILKGDGVEVWEQLFEYHGFRYVGVEGNCELVEIEALTVHTDIQPLAHFHCDNELINRIHGAVNNSILTCCQGGIFVDCPHREQNEWTGDALLGSETICMSFDVYDSFLNWMYSFKDDQKGDGQLGCIIPSGWSVWSANFANGIDWDSAIIHIPYYCMKYTGNREIVDLVWDNMLKSMEFFATMSETHLQDHGLGDWSPAARDVRADRCITDTAFYRWDALMLAEMAEFTGRDAEPFIKLADDIKREFRAKYVKDGRLTDSHETALAMSIFVGFLEPQECVEEAQRLADTLKANGYCFKGGTHELRTIFDVLSKYGHTQVLFDTLVNDQKPGYASNLKDGCNTIWENFDGRTSRNHYFKCQPNGWMYKWLAGIQINGFGFDDVVIEPRFVKGINSLQAEMHGIKVEYENDRLSVCSPYDFTLKLNGKTEKHTAGSYEFSVDRRQVTEKTPVCQQR